MKSLYKFAKKLHQAGYSKLAHKLVSANEEHNKKVLEEWQKTKEDDIYQKLMDEIPMMPENETLDQQVKREMQMESELPAESDLDVVMRALQKRTKSKSKNLSDLLDETDALRKRKENEPVQEERVLHSQQQQQRFDRRYKVSVLYPSVNNEGQPFFDSSTGVSEDLSVTAGELEGLKKEESLGYLKVLEVKSKLPKDN